MSTEIPADATVGATLALAAIIKPSSNALPEAFIRDSFYNYVLAERVGRIVG
jgi:hypothetical protein